MISASVHMEVDSFCFVGLSQLNRNSSIKGGK